MNSQTLLLDSSLFWFTDVFEEAYPIFKRELATLHDELFDPWPIPDAYTGSWTIYPLIGENPPDGYQVDLASNLARCPDTAEFLLQIPRLRLASFSRLTPGSFIHAHTDAPFPGIIRCHLGLSVPEGATLIVAGERLTWDDGKLLLFDGQIVHGVINESDRSRDVMLLDMELTEDERAIAGI